MLTITLFSFKFRSVSFLIDFTMNYFCRCPLDPLIISKFEVNSDRTQATAQLKSMFKFPEGIVLILQLNQFHFVK